MPALRPSRAGETPPTEERAPQPPSTRPRRRTPQLLGLVLVLTIAGAVAGSTYGTAPSERFIGEAVITVQADAEAGNVAGTHDIQWHTAAATAELPAVLQTAARGVAPVPGLSSLQQRVSVAGSPKTSLLRIRVRDRTTAAAGALATAIARETVLFLRRLSRANLQSTDRTQSFSFDRGLDGWSRINSLFAVSPTAVTRDPSAQQGGTHSLRVVCGQALGCGPHRRIQRSFVASSRYRATVYARASGTGAPAPRVRLVLGTSARDIAAGTSVTLTSLRWQLLSVRWTPSANATSAEVATQTSSRGPTTVFLDSATVAEDIPNRDQRVQRLADAQSLRQRARRVAEGDNYAVVGSASAAGEIETDTVWWTFGGALLGLLMGSTGLAAAELARRRKHP